MNALCVAVLNVYVSGCDVYMECTQATHFIDKEEGAVFVDKSKEGGEVRSALKVCTLEVSGDEFILLQFSD